MPPFELDEHNEHNKQNGPLPQGAVIKVIGVGGAGGNAVQHMLDHQVEGVNFIAVNTDAQALAGITGGTALQIGTERTKGLGAGAKADVGRQAAVDDRERIAEAMHGADMVFVTAGMGGGTGTGAAPVVAGIAKEKNLLTVGVVTKPFFWENRTTQAEQGIDELTQNVDSVIVIPNDKLGAVMPADVSLEDAFAAVDDVLLGAVRGVADIILKAGYINVDFSDVRTVMSEHGLAVMGTGQKSGEGRAEAAAQEAVSSPLLDDIDISDARAVLVNVSAKSVSLQEWTAVGAVVNNLKAADATVILGTVQDDDLGEDLRVTIIATGLRDKKAEAAPLRAVTDETANRAGPGRSNRRKGAWSDLDAPAVNRRADRSQTAERAQQAPEPGEQKILEIDAFVRSPSFARRQAD